MSDYDVHRPRQRQPPSVVTLTGKQVEEILSGGKMKSVVEEAIVNPPLGGVKYDAGKPDMSLIPSAAALEEAAVWSYGAKKYAEFNWHKGIKYSKVLSAMERHMTLLKAGADFDYENGLHNAAAIRCCAGMLIQFTLEGRTELDNRIKLTADAIKKLEKMAQGASIYNLLKEVHE